MRIYLYAGRHAGVTVLLTLTSLGHTIVGVLAVDEQVARVAASLGCPVRTGGDVNSDDVFSDIQDWQAELFVCCHGRQIVKNRLLDALPCINFHPNLSRYPGRDPVERMLRDGVSEASVGCHVMTEKVDEGPVICEVLQRIEGNLGGLSPIDVYNQLYSTYCLATIDASRKFLQLSNSGM